MELINLHADASEANGGNQAERIWLSDRGGQEAPGLELWGSENTGKSKVC